MDKKIKIKKDQRKLVNGKQRIREFYRKGRKNASIHTSV